MSQVVFLVSGGDYSDYHVKAIFSTLAAAEQFIVEEQAAWESVNPNRSRFLQYAVEERDMDSPVAESGGFQVVIDRTGAILKEDFFHPFTPCDPEFEERAWHFQTRTYVWNFTGYGRTLEHARRSAEELRRQTLTLRGEVV